ncbi:DNA-directed RNA polymerase specialized sigma subunit [Moorella thermoacetica Y72]|uniref:DNA-directed RNA polymerase specialized sigma subunit n=1 Tax=Moorella thermoacetica Y72 TaxID=1325331 RepID=A0A0S6UAV1_NEOTH|nr:sigma factor [Moorella thermoacetica]GAF24716.1 DNA-directed RNA polymerase specialized sigma subunit [Moorella thermoacetica Y72]
MEAGFVALVALSVLKGISLLLSYISNNAFPQPLSEEEEQKYLELWLQGDQKARNILIEHNLRLVAHITKKFENTGEDTEDLISIGTVGLIKAINTYNKAKGTKLATYAARCIENDILITKTGRVTQSNKVRIMGECEGAIIPLNLLRGYMDPLTFPLQ